MHRFTECEKPSGHVRQGSFSAMSPSLETGYSFGPTCNSSSVPRQWSQDQCADTRENYVDICFSQSKMNGSQPCLASEPKVQENRHKNVVHLEYFSDKPSVMVHLKYRAKNRSFHKNTFAKPFFTSSTTPAAVSSIII